MNDFLTLRERTFIKKIYMNWDTKICYNDGGWKEVLELYQKRSFWVKIVALILAVLMVFGVIASAIFSMI